jgi:hypothetical protein
MNIQELVLTAFCEAGRQKKERMIQAAELSADPRISVIPVRVSAKKN